MGLKTPLYQLHEQMGAKFVDFAGWDMPVHFGSQVEEHHAVRSDAGMFDVSHMTVVEIDGVDRRSLLEKVLANDVNRVAKPGGALYSAMLNESGGVLDDLIVYVLSDRYLMVVNCGTRAKDLDWLSKQAETLQCSVREREDLCILAIQGPHAIDKVRQIATADQQRCIESLTVFQGAWSDGWFIARTGYTGERGLEILLPEEAAVLAWQELLALGVPPIGLGARDTLRLEAGMNLYGNDMDESVTPLESNMEATVSLTERSFIGATALSRQKTDGVSRVMVGLILKSRGVMRAHYPVMLSGQPVGEITSGAHSPTLGHSVALARITTPVQASGYTVAIRGREHPVELVRPPFVRNGRQVYKPFSQSDG